MHSNYSQASAADLEISKNEAREQIDSTLEKFGASPLKSFHAINKVQKPNLIKDKVEKLQEPLKKTFAEALDVDFSEVAELNDENAELANDMRRLLLNIKAQIDTAKEYKDKIQLLTLIPDSWTIQRAVDYFGVTEYAVKKAVALRDTQGILAVPKIYSRQRISQETLTAVKNMYIDDEYSRMLPGQKDFKKVNGEKMQKRLMLFKIEELYNMFRQNHPELKIGLSKFYALRPKWCILVGSKGTHSVCTCLKHENAKLLASETDFDYKVIAIFYLNLEFQNQKFHSLN